MGDAHHAHKCLAQNLAPFLFDTVEMGLGAHDQRLAHHCRTGHAAVGERVGGKALIVRTKTNLYRIE